MTAPGGRDNDTGVVLAALNSRDISTQTMNSLAQSGHRAEVFTAEVQDRAEARLQRMKTNASPVQLVRNLSGHQDISQAVDSLHDRVRTDAGLAVWRAINDQRTVVISELKLATEAQKYHPDLEAIGNEIGAMIKNGELLSVSAGGEPVLVSRSTREMEKAILRVVEEGKGTQQPLLEQVPEAVLNGLTDGQKKGDHPGAGYHGSVYRDSGLCWRGENHSTEGGDICTGDPTGGRSSGDDGACSYAPGGERNERRRCPGADHQILCR